jgi:integrase
MDHLKQRGHSWYVRVVVPERLRAAVGKREYTVALGTRDKALARSRSHAVLAKINAELKAAEEHREFPLGSPERLLEIAAEQRAAVADGHIDEDSAEAGMDMAAEQTLDILRAKYGTDSEGNPNTPESVTRGVARAWRKFQGEEVSLLREQVELYVTEVTPTVRAQTVQDKRRVYGELLGWLGVDAEVKDVTRKTAGNYVSAVMARSGKAPKTLKSELAQLSALWKYMVGRGVAEVNVWHLMSATLPKQRRGGVAGSRRAWTEAEQLRVLRETDTGDPIWSSVALALYSGARLEELCQLKTADVHDGALHIRVGKSSAAVRKVPVHPVILPLVKRLTETSIDGYLLPGLLIAGRDNKRSVYLSKRIQWHLRKQLKIADPGFVFHGTRHTFTNACERAGVPLSTAQLIVGHSRRGSITYGAPGASYSHGLPLEQIAAEIRKVTYGKAVDDLVKDTAGRVEVTFRSTRRPRARRALRGTRGSLQ